MTEQEVLEQITLGEDSQRQFKREITHVETLVNEFTALSNSKGGKVYIGIEEKQGATTITGLNATQLWKTDLWIKDAGNLVKPPCYPFSENINVSGKTIIVVHISEGAMKPYATNNGVYLVKSGSNVEKAAPAEILRLFQESGMINLDEMVTPAVIDEELNRPYFINFVDKNYPNAPEWKGQSYPQLLANMNLAKDGKFNLAGLLLFASTPQKFRGDAVINAVSYYGNKIEGTSFKSRSIITGNLEDQFDGAMAFIKNELRRIQTGSEFNQSGKPEISFEALQEALINAVLHRDYGKSADIRLMIFGDRLEIVSPGSLPNHLTIKNISYGNSVKRNQILCSFAQKLLPYSGLGSGVPRIIELEPNVLLENDKDGEQFKVIFKRP